MKFIPLFGKVFGVGREIDDPRRKSRATAKGHIHNHRPTYKPPKQPARTHAWYRRHGKVAPSRRPGGSHSFQKRTTRLQLDAMMGRRPK